MEGLNKNYKMIITEKLEVVNVEKKMAQNALEAINLESLEWHDARKHNPDKPRDYFVFVGHTDRHGIKRGFITIAHWTGRMWEVFNLLDQDEIPHITHWIEWMPGRPEGYEVED